MLRAILTEFAGGAPELVEVGAGYGANLFALADAGWPRLRGLDISPVGIETGRKIAERFGLKHITFERVDLTDAGDVAARNLQGRVVFSHYSFEQIPQHTETALMNLLNAGVARVIHIEPAIELLSWLSPRDWVCRAYIHSMDYQRSLVRTLRRMERAGLIRIVAARRLYYAPTIRHDPSVICWEPAR
jgi:SAM-dependent methyltransferase